MILSIQVQLLTKEVNWLKAEQCFTKRTIDTIRHQDDFICIYLFTFLYVLYVCTYFFSCVCMCKCRPGVKFRHLSQLFSTLVFIFYIYFIIIIIIYSSFTEYRLASYMYIIQEFSAVLCFHTTPQMPLISVAPSCISLSSSYFHPPIPAPSPSIVLFSLFSEFSPPPILLLYT